MNLKEIEYIQICTEELVLAIPSTHPARKNAVWDKTGRYPELSIEEVRKIFYLAGIRILAGYAPRLG